MQTVNIVALCVLFMILGFFGGMYTNHEVSHYSGRMQERSQAKKDAMTWAKKELKAHCPAWFTDRRSSDYMACKKPEWMK